MNTFTLHRICNPNPDVRSAAKIEPRDDIKGLIGNSIDPITFFSRNHPTPGLIQIIQASTARLRGESASGVIVLRQSMGGGKTHAQITAGLVAKNVALLKKFFPDVEAPDDNADVVALDGRSKFKNGTWGEIARQLGDKSTFAHLYQGQLEAPSPEEWQSLLQGKRALILIDELRPYIIDHAASVSIGSTTLANLERRALANLMTALPREGLEEVCVIISDLDAEYGEGKQMVDDLIAVLMKEAERGCLTLEPVPLNSNDLFAILRKRLFDEIPKPADIKAVADAYRQALKQAAKNNLARADAETLADEIQHTYPFHPSIKPLLQRFRHNLRFQQTRGAIRLMASAVNSAFYDTGRAKNDFLVGFEHLDLNDQRVIQELDQINSGLANARVTDIANKGKSHAELLSSSEESNLPADIAQLLLIGSLSSNQAETGLLDTELCAYMAKPDFKVEQVPDVATKLMDLCDYSQRSADGKRRFMERENPFTWIRNQASNLSREQRVKSLARRLEDMFASGAKPAVYKSVHALPSLDDVVTDPGDISLIIHQPGDSAELPVALQSFWEKARFKNRLLFLSGNRNGFDRILQLAATVYAHHAWLALHKNEDSAEVEEVTERVALREKGLREALIECFNCLHYPTDEKSGGLGTVTAMAGRKFSGELAIQSALTEAGKYFDKATLEQLLITDNQRGAMFEDILFTLKCTPWSEMRERAATQISFCWGPPGYLESAKAFCVGNGTWRAVGDQIEKGPFEKEKTAVVITAKEVKDSTVLSLMTFPSRMVKVLYAEGRDATENDPPLKDPTTYSPQGLHVSFLVIDQTHEHPTGVAATWIGAPKIKYNFVATGELELEATHDATIYYTLDGSKPVEKKSPKYTDPVKLPKECSIVQVLAVAPGANPREEVIQVQKTGTVEEPPNGKQLVWNPPGEESILRSDETQKVLDQTKACSGMLHDVRVQFQLRKEDRYIEVAFGSKSSCQEVEKVIAAVAREIGDEEDPTKRRLLFDGVQFSKVADCVEWCKQRKQELNRKYVSYG